MTDEVWYTRSREEDWCFIKLCDYKKDREITKLKRMTTKLQKLQQLTTKLQSYNACRRHFMWTEPLIRRTEPVISLSKPLYLPPNHQPEIQGCSLCSLWPNHQPENQSRRTDQTTKPSLIFIITTTNTNFNTCVFFKNENKNNKHKLCYYCNT